MRQGIDGQHASAQELSLHYLKRAASGDLAALPFSIAYASIGLEHKPSCADCLALRGIGLCELGFASSAGNDADFQGAYADLQQAQSCVPGKVFSFMS